MPDWCGWINDLKGKIDLVHVSSGALQKADVHVYPGYMLPLAQEIAEGTGLPTIGVGLLDDEGLLINALEDNRCTLAAMGRELLRSPNKTLELAQRFGQQELIPMQYQRAYKELL